MEEKTNLAKIDFCASGGRPVPDAFEPKHKLGQNHLDFVGNPGFKLPRLLRMWARGTTRPRLLRRLNKIVEEPVPENGLQMGEQIRALLTQHLKFFTTSELMEAKRDVFTSKR